MKIMKAVILSGTKMLSCDAIEHEGKLWLVPRWIEDRAAGTRAPMRIVRFDSLRHQKTPNRPHDYRVNDPIPMSVLDGVTTYAAGVQYEVVEAPAILTPLTPRLN